MSAEELTDAAPASGLLYGEPLNRICHRLGISLATAYRMILREKTLRDGRKVRCRATRVRGKWYVQREDLDEYFAALTADALGRANPSSLPTPATVCKSHQAADTALIKAGF